MGFAGTAGRAATLARRAVEKEWNLIARFARRLADAGELEGSELEAALTSSSWAGTAHSRWRGGS
ncbi:MAG: hypothetical protein WBP56_03705 [Polyangia bacterium]